MFQAYPNPDEPELKIEYSFENIQSFEYGENIPIQVFCHNMHKNIS